MSIQNNKSQFEHDHPNFCPQQDGKIQRKIVELFFKIVCNFWRTLGSYFLKVSLSDETKKFDKPENQNSLMVRELKHKRTIGPTTVVEYSQTLRSCNENLEVVNNFLFNAMNSNLPNSDKDLIFLPVVLKSGVRDHIVAVVYNKTANRVELYDPKGLVALDRGDWVRNQDQLKLIDVLMKVVDQYGDENTTIWENTAKHQKDSHNCGIYVLDYIERRLEGETAEQIAANGLSFSEVNNSRRDDFLRTYFQHCQNSESDLDKM